MPAPVELALSTLLPAVCFLPPDLISLANSLLSQSRAKAASLKPEEEIGRTYACAQIACERLKNRLALEIGEAKPPCQPRVYRKLYVYLDGVLGMPRTPKGERKRDALGGGEGNGSDQVTTGSRGKGKGTPGRVKEVDGTPSKKDATAGGGEVKTPTTATKVGGKRTREEVVRQEEEQAATEGLPVFLMPLVRALCKATSTPKAVPHILVGAQAVATEIASRAAPKAEGSERKRRRRTPQSARSVAKAKVEEQTSAASVPPGSAVGTSQWPAMLITLHTLTVARMRGVENSDEQVERLREEAVEAARDFAQASTGSETETLAERLDPKTLQKDIEFYTLEAEDSGWLEMEWYRNVPEDDEEVEMDNDHDAEQEEEEEEEEETITPRKKPHKTPLRRKEKHGGKAALFSSSGEIQDQVGAAGLLSGMGTMFQPSLDWLDEERRADYRSWKKGVLKEIAATEAGV